MSTDSPAVYCVLGMHRSGTSLVAHTLQVLGVYLGPTEHLMDANEFNPRGFWEHQVITDLDDAILARLGGSWSEPPAMGPGWERRDDLDDLRRQARALIQEDFGGRAVWGWKDPRTCLTLPFWRDLLPPLRYVVCVRHPIDVARSLNHQHGFDLETGLRLWVSYTAASLRHVGGQPRLLVSYEDLMNEPRSEFRRIARFVGQRVLGEQEGLLQAYESETDRGLWHHRTQADTPLQGELPFAVEALRITLRLLTDFDRQKGDREVHDRAAVAIADAAERVYAPARDVVLTHPGCAE